jgi:heme/copper-type cytochrome/quinol oxidase subunit 1
MSYDQPPPPPDAGNPYGAPQYGGPPAQDPGRTMGIVGLVLAIFCSLIGMIVSIIAYNKSKAAGFKNNIALAGIIVGAALFVLSLIVNFTIGLPMMQQGG